jgi:hypothetical protein
MNLYQPYTYLNTLPTGQVALGGAAAVVGRGLFVKNQASKTTDISLALQKIASQTADFLNCYDTDNTTSLAKVDIAGAATFSGLTISSFSTAGVLVTSAAGVVSRVTGTSGQILVHDGTNWAATNRKEKAGTVNLTNGTTSKAITFTAARSDALYTPIWTFINTVDADPVSIPHRVIAISTTGFTVEWDDALLTDDYDGYWAILEHYDPA